MVFEFTFKTTDLPVAETYTSFLNKMDSDPHASGESTKYKKVLYIFLQ